MEKVLDEIECNLGFQLPSEIVSLYKKGGDFAETTFIFDVRPLGSHWLLNADYFLIKPSDLNTRERGRYLINEFYVKYDENILKTINRKVAQSVKQYWLEDKVFAFAWSNDVVERDASLVYVFKDDGSPKGIYIHSLNYVNEKVFVAENLTDFFELNEVGSSRGMDKFKIPFKGLNKPFSYKELLKDSYKVIDGESVDDVRDYEHIIKTFSNLSGGKFEPIIKSLYEKDSIRNIEIELNSRKYFTKVQGDTDYVDLKIIDFINECLVDNGHTRKKFVAFRDVKFGQEVGIAFVGSSTLKALKELRTVTIIKE